MFVDVGAAEGIISLENIDHVRKCYLIEYDSKWIEALRATFEPYQEKTVIVPKKASDYNDSVTIKLDTLVKERNGICIKIDVEGFELQVLKGAQEIMISSGKKKLAVCCYHKGDDREKIISFLDGYFNINVVPNYIYCPYELIDGVRVKTNMPYLRSAVIRAWK